MSRKMNYQTLERESRNIARGLNVWMDLAKRATHSQDIVDDQGNGDWTAVADRMAQLAARPPTGRVVSRDGALRFLILVACLMFIVGILIGLGVQEAIA